MDPFIAASMPRGLSPRGQARYLLASAEAALVELDEYVESGVSGALGEKLDILAGECTSLLDPEEDEDLMKAAGCLNQLAQLLFELEGQSGESEEDEAKITQVRELEDRLIRLSPGDGEHAIDAADEAAMERSFR